MKNAFSVKKDLLWKIKTKFVVDWMRYSTNTTIPALNRSAKIIITNQMVCAVKKDIFGIKARTFAIIFWYLIVIKQKINSNVRSAQLGIN